jgi:hypothetical protein
MGADRSPEARPRPDCGCAPVRHGGPAGTAGGPIDEAVAELRVLAAGRGDLLAEQAGIMAGACTVRVETGDYAIAVGLLVLAGADHDRIAGWVEVGRERAPTPRHSI